MVRQSTPVFCQRAFSTLCLAVTLALFTSPAQAATPLTRAVISSLRNQVRLLPQNNAHRKARLSDVLIPGDGLVTSRRSLAELRFNDGSLARMGEQAIFRFVPRQRSFRLGNGTVLMLIPPGRGTTRLRTPNVTAGIRGSALLVRYNAEDDSTIVIALTDSQISVTNRSESQQQVLAAGQAVVAVGDEITETYDVDLLELYKTSPLLQGLDLDKPDAPAQDPAIAQVRQETLAGIRNQTPFEPGEGQVVTQQFRLPEADVDTLVANETGRPFGNALPEEPLPGSDLDGERSTAGSIGPGPALGLGDRLNDEGREGRPADPPAIAEPPVEVEPPVAVDPPVVDEPPMPPVFDEPPVVADPPVIDEPPVIADPPVIDDGPGGDGTIDGLGEGNDIVVDSFPDSPPPLDDGVSTLLPDEAALPPEDDLVGGFEGGGADGLELANPAPNDGPNALPGDELATDDLDSDDLITDELAPPEESDLSDDGVAPDAPDPLDPVSEGDGPPEPTRGNGLIDF